MLARLRRSDPGLLALRHAATTTLAAVAAMLAMRSLLPLAGSAAAPALIVAPMAAALSSSFTYAQDDAGRRRAMRLCGLAAAAAPWPVAGLDAALPPTEPGAETALVQAWVVLVVFAAFYIRRFGAVYVGVGLFAFTLTFFASVTRVSLEGAPFVSLGGALGVALSWIARFHLLPADPARAYADAVARLREDVAATLGTLAGLIAAPDPPALAAVREPCRAMRAVLTRARPLIDARGEESRARLTAIAALAYDLELAIEVAVESLGALHGDGTRLTAAVAAPLETALRAAALRIAGRGDSRAAAAPLSPRPDVGAVAALGPPERAQHALRLAVAVMRIGVSVDGLARLGAEGP